MKNDNLTIEEKVIDNKIKKLERDKLLSFFILGGLGLLFLFSRGGRK